MLKSLKVDHIREDLDEVTFAGPAFVLYAAQKAPFSLVGLVADGKNYLPNGSVPVKKGERWIVVPLTPAPADDSEIWWGALAASANAGFAAILVQGQDKRLLGRKESIAKGEVWTGSSTV